MRISDWSADVCSSDLRGLPLALTIAGSAFAGEADKWLSRMSDALSQTDYQGSLVYLDGNRMETLKVYRSAHDSRESLVVLTAEHREIVRAGHTLTSTGAGYPSVECGMASVGD